MYAATVETSFVHETPSAPSIEAAPYGGAAAAGDCPEIAVKILAFVLDNFAEEVRLEDLASAAGMSRFNFCRRFHRDCGVPPIRWLWNFRTILAAEFIALDPRWSLTDVAFACGFSSSAHFSRSFKAMFRKSPSAYRRAKKDSLAGPAKLQTFDSLFSENRDVVDLAARRAIKAGE